jgi:tetratricopeptide (TPR) repeat protein
MYCLSQLENLESALEYARKLYHGKPHIILATILKCLGKAHNSGKSLEYLREGKEMMCKVLGLNHAHPITLKILVIMGIIYLDVYSDFAKAYQCFQDALSMKTIFYGESNANDESASIYTNLACTMHKMGNLSQAKIYYVEAVKIRRKISMTKKTCADFVATLNRLSSVCKALREHEEALKYLDEGREVANVRGHQDWKVVIILLDLYIRYLMMKSFDSFEKAVMCCLEAREMAMNLPKDDSDPNIMKINKLLHIT